MDDLQRQLIEAQLIAREAKSRVAEIRAAIKAREKAGVMGRKSDRRVRAERNALLVVQSVRDGARKHVQISRELGITPNDTSLALSTLSPKRYQAIYRLFAWRSYHWRVNEAKTPYYKKYAQRPSHERFSKRTEKETAYDLSLNWT
jgi:hypothetical protein